MEVSRVRLLSSRVERRGTRGGGLEVGMRKLLKNLGTTREGCRRGGGRMLELSWR